METLEECEVNLLRIYSEKAKLETLLGSIGVSSADMIWAKDIDGRYMWANSKIISGLLFSKSLTNTVGKTDMELSDERRKSIGAENHTAGPICADSDTIVLSKERPMKFVETFMVNGQLLVLEVHKDVMRDAMGTIIGTVGVGRDITYEFTRLTALSKEEEIPQRFRECISDLINRNYLGEEGGTKHGAD